MKIFGIGMFKTGTTTLGRALSNLGFSVFNGPWITEGEIYNNAWNPNLHHFEKYKKSIIEKVEAYDAFADYPFMYIYPLLDQWFPGSLFIYTERNPYEVAHSDRAMWLRNGEPLFKIPPTRRFVERYNQHRQEVLSYFEGREDFLRVNWGASDGWEKLCGFLDCPVPNTPFPHRNSGSYQIKNNLKLMVSDIVVSLDRWKSP
ncbi:hypothetical protein PCC7418_2772 [Halothece sp. PCC 7418]|uniref:sulfotransferase n=1 Tax=Halothece sp. (strain PCC 7418) TaxID=65093 RepID=UPI0002A089C5|nr:sulfotransferase [Halothece sp. PCC 7418]AFZ44908.1 hypothetical protein PCC7418_2772 [Halothece sp. PCC 7418]